MKLKVNHRIKPLNIGEDRTISWVFEKEKYEIDIIKVYEEIKKQFDKSAILNSNIDKEKYLQRLIDEIQYYCEDRNIDFEYHFTFVHGFINIKNTSKLYNHALVYQLTCIDKSKIRLFLNDHKNNYPNAKKFVNLVESQVYPAFTNSYPFDDLTERKEIMTKWIEYCNIQDKTYSKKHSIAFDKLFFNDKFGDKLIEILTQKTILNEDGSWIGLSFSATDITSLITVLKNHGYIKKSISQEVIGKLFCEKFKISLSSSSMRHQSKKSVSYNNDYESIFPKR